MTGITLPLDDVCYSTRVLLFGEVSKLLPLRDEWTAGVDTLPLVCIQACTA